MRILDISTFGVRGIADATYDFAKKRDADGVVDAHEVVVISGGPASGKTRLLELLVATREAFVETDGSVDQEHWIRPEHRSARAVASWLLSEEERASIGSTENVHKTEIVFGDEESTFDAPPSLVYLFERYDHLETTPKVEYFAENRRLEVGGGDIPMDLETQAHFRMSKSARKYAWLPSFLAGLQAFPPKQRRFAETLGQLSATCSYGGENDTRLRSRNRPIGALAELSSSEADAVLLAATATMVGLSNSMILIDRPEFLGREPNELLDGLIAIGRGNQLIVATDHPELASGRPHAQIQLQSTSPASAAARPEATDAR